MFLLTGTFMLYSFAKMLMTAGLRFFYRRIHVTGFEHIPASGPVIIIANHNSSLMDAALLGILLKRRAWFFARGDVFVNRPVQKLLWWLHMMPVHSHTGGRKTLKANQDSFSSGQQILSAGGVIVFFPESYSHVEHQLLPFRKGVFRLAFNTAAAHQYAFDIPVVPIGINYDHPVDYRTGVQVHAGQPLYLSAYVNEYKQNNAAALLHICKDAYQAVHPLVLHIANKNRLRTAEQYLIISRNSETEAVSSWKVPSAEKLIREQHICTAINQAADADFKNIKQTADLYFNKLSAAALPDKAATGAFSFPAWKKLIMWCGFPLYATGLLLNGLPFFAAHRIADKKVYRKDFYSWIFVVCYSFMYLFWLMILLAVTLTLGWQYAIGLVMAIIAIGLFTYTYTSSLQEYRDQKKWQLLSPETKSELIALRNNLRASLQ